MTCLDCPAPAKSRGCFDVVLADPAWDYRNFSDAMHGAAAGVYDVMTTDDICALPVLFDEAVGDATTNHSADFRQYVEEAIAAERKAWAGELSKRDGEIADLKNALALKDDVEIDLVGFAVFGKSAAGRAMREAQLLPERTKDTIRLRKAEAQERRDARRGQKYIFTLRRAAGGAA